MNRSIITAIALSLTTALSIAQVSPIGRDDVAASGAIQRENVDFKKNVLSKMGVDERPGEFVPADVPMVNQHGQTIRFGDLFAKRPVVIMPMFFECKGVCGVEADSLIRTAIQLNDLNVGRDYDIVMLSINPKETHELTFPRWRGVVKLYGRPEAEQGFHFLTGKLEDIRKITDSLGFKWVYDPVQDTINHPAGIMVVAPDRKITGYLVNKEFPRTFVTHLINDAKESKISRKTEPMLFGCIMIDHATGKRSLVIENVIRLCAAIFAIGVATWIVGMSLSEKNRKAKGGLA